jgi:hypothetical protein
MSPDAAARDLYRRVIDGWMPATPMAADTLMREALSEALTQELSEELTGQH